MPLHSKQRTERKRVIRMVKVSIKVRSGAASFNASVRAESVEQALSLVGRRYPSSDVRVRSLTNPESLSADTRNARTRMAGSGRTNTMAA
jgi:hypothetical protein